MYTPAHFAEERIDRLHEFIRAHPLAVLVTSGAGNLEASHIPVVLHPEIGAQGVLRCHLARANPEWRTLEASPEVLAIFCGAQHYITPNWYPSKEQHGKVVPTWNYLAVHVYGKASTFEDPALLHAHLSTLTEQQEQPYPEPWRVQDAPADYISALSKAIVGVEIAITGIEGKWKASQNRPDADRRGVIDGLSALDTEASRAMARIVRERSED